LLLEKLGPEVLADKLDCL
jgi:hypothetical protein